ncbi:MAG: carbon-nitrogen hydrolase family protein [Calditrichaeota bacterium]|nr:MAG: carbon-nitrogen hydrolase family protein [Calditrichota bacterium]
MLSYASNTTHLTIALGQFEPQWGKIEANMGQMLQMIDAAGKQKADVIVFPELSRTGYAPCPTAEEIERLGEVLPSPDSRRLAEAAGKYNMMVVYGTLEQGPHGLAYNTAVCLEGGQLHRYHKTHVHWTENFAPGSDLAVFSTRWGRIGMLICFDLGFPEAARTLALQGAEIIISPAAVPEDFKEIHRRRVMARALDNQLFVLYCNHAGTAYGGGSAVAHPTGEIVLLADERPDVYIHTLRLEDIAAWRDREQLFAYRRPELYQL